MITSEYDDLVRLLRKKNTPISVDAADAITRLTREVASARAAGAEEMRATVLNAIRTGLFTYKLSDQRDDEMDAALKANIQDMREQVLDRLTALPLPSPVAVQAVPEGWKLVPVEPTAAMGSAAYDAWDAFGEDAVLGPEETIAIYRAMLAASPSPTAGE